MNALPGRRGSSLIEFVIVAIPMLLLGLATLEVSRWHITRLTVGHALLEAARAAQDGWRDPEQVRQRFETRLLPLWASEASESGQDRARERLRTATAELYQRTGTPLWELHPGQASAGHPVPDSLILQAIYWHRPLVPGISALMRQLGRVPPSTPVRQAMQKTGWVPVRQRLAIEWHQPAGARAAVPTPLLAVPTAGAAVIPSLTNETGSLFLPRCHGDGCRISPLPAGPDSPLTPAPPSDPPPADLCGVVLCCLDPGGQVVAKFRHDLASGKFDYGQAAPT